MSVTRENAILDKLFFFFLTLLDDSPIKVDCKLTLFLYFFQDSYSNFVFRY